MFSMHYIRLKVFSVHTCNKFSLTLYLFYVIRTLNHCLKKINIIVQTKSCWIYTYTFSSGLLLKIGGRGGGVGIIILLYLEFLEK